MFLVVPMVIPLKKPPCGGEQKDSVALPLNASRGDRPSPLALRFQTMVNRLLIYYNESNTFSKLFLFK